ncbi:MAG: outer membrane lipoprotein carrier protein LolA [Betaproteobacteria bacterium]|nr:outer membrane lipoprotein carrier protein LolA [Betaproteobacteria bacterium]MDH4323415.1 outer membrane lipoprotein carrier protein LolA [Betaproteobacteria bacterium]MDH5210158.1 outer membrane lipoprotein carrier protein LolA [Betaproteobacteria bacterium]
MPARRTLLALLLACASAAQAAPPWTLERLLQGFAQTREAHASFVEKKMVRVLEAPLVSSGELHFAAPDRLEKRTLRPRPEILRLEGDTLTLERGERRLQLSLRAQPQAAAFVESIRGTLAGDRQALERAYTLRLEGAERAWALTLTPREPDIAQLVQRIRIAGQRAEVTVIEILQANGDSTLMSVQRLPAP